LVAGGYRKDHIIVMAADDIAQDPDNPMPGKVFNAPGEGPVYVFDGGLHVCLRDYGDAWVLAAKRQVHA
jgi:legumain